MAILKIVQKSQEGSFYEVFPYLNALNFAVFHPGNLCRGPPGEYCEVYLVASPGLFHLKPRQSIQVAREQSGDVFGLMTGYGLVG